MEGLAGLSMFAGPMKREDRQVLKSQKIELRRSEIRQKLNEISGLDGEAFTDEIKAESAELEKEFGGLDTQFRAALIAEDGETTTTTETTETESRETTELRALTDGVMLGSYLSTALGGGSLEAREAELNQHLNLDDAVIPWAAIAPRVEHRAEVRVDAVTPAPGTTSVGSSSIIERVFADSAAAYLGVDLPSVPAGIANFPVLTSGGDGSTVDKDFEVDATAATFTPNTLSPMRLQASYLFRREDRAVLAGMEDALRADLSGALSEALDKVIVAGQAANPVVPGFLGTGLAAPADPAVISDFAAYVASTAGQIDGRYAMSAGDVRLLVGADTIAHMHSLFSAGSGESAAGYVARLFGGLRVSAHIPDTDADEIQGGVVARGSQRAAVAPVWEGLSLVRDEITQAAQGRLRLTLVMLYSFKIVRAAQFSRVAFKLA